MEKKKSNAICTKKKGKKRQYNGPEGGREKRNLLKKINRN